MDLLNETGMNKYMGRDSTETGTLILSTRKLGRFELPLLATTQLKAALFGDGTETVSLGVSMAHQIINKALIPEKEHDLSEPYELVEILKLLAGATLIKYYDLEKIYGDMVAVPPLYELRLDLHLLILKLEALLLECKSDRIMMQKYLLFPARIVKEEK